MWHAPTLHQTPMRCHRKRGLRARVPMQPNNGRYPKNVLWTPPIPLFSLYGDDHHLERCETKAVGNTQYTSGILNFINAVTSTLPSEIWFFTLNYSLFISYFYCYIFSYTVVITYLWCYIVIHYIKILQFIHSPLDIHGGCFYYWNQCYHKHLHVESMKNCEMTIVNIYI